MYALYDILGIELMRLVWMNSWNMMGWVVGYWYEFVMHDKFMVGWWDMTMVWIGRNSINFLMRSHGSVICDGHNFMNLLVRSHGDALCGRHNFMDLLVKFHW